MITKSILLISLSILLSLTSTQDLTLEDSPTPIAPFDVNKITGKWYMILLFNSHITNSSNYSKHINCFSQNYTLEGILNQSYIYQSMVWNGNLFPTVHSLTFDKDSDDIMSIDSVERYWLALDEEHYETGMIGTPDGTNLWVLARHPEMSQNTLLEYVRLAKKQGYTIAKQSSIVPKNDKC